MTKLSQSVTDLAFQALNASWGALTALENDVTPEVDGDTYSVVEELIEAIETRDIFRVYLLGIVEQLVDDLALPILQGTTRTTHIDAHSSSGSWVETSRNESAESLVRATAVLLDLQQALRAFHDRVEAERAVARLFATA